MGKDARGVGLGGGERGGSVWGGGGVEGAQDGGAWAHIGGLATKYFLIY